MKITLVVALILNVVHRIQNVSDIIYTTVSLPIHSKPYVF